MSGAMVHEVNRPIHVMSRRIQVEIPLLLISILLLLLLQLFFPSQGWMVLLVALGGLFLVSAAWVVALGRGLALERALRFGWARVGDPVEERFTLIDKAPLPALWALVDDQSTLPGYDASTATGVGGGEENHWIIRSQCTRRGLYRIGPTRLRTGDPFGVFRLTIEYPASATMIVMPRIVPLPGIEIAPGGRAGEGKQQVNALERAVVAASVRDYRPGDSFDTIHWPTTARRQELFVKRFDSTPSSDWWIVLDLDSQVQAGEGASSTVESGIILAASLADRGLSTRRAVGLVASGDSLVWLPPAQGEPQRWEILRALAMTNPGHKSLDELIASVAPTLGRRASVIFITPSVSAKWLPHLLALRWRGLEPTVLLLDSQTFRSDPTPGPDRVAILLDELARQGITRYRVTRDLFESASAFAAEHETWDWRISGTGKARALHAPLETGWKVLP